MKVVNQEKSSKKLAAIKSVEFNQKLSSQRHISIWESFIYEPGTMQKAITNTWYKLLSRTIVLQLKTSRGFDVSAERKSQSEWRFIDAFCCSVLLCWRSKLVYLESIKWFTAGSLNGHGPVCVFLLAPQLLYISSRYDKQLLDYSKIWYFCRRHFSIWVAFFWCLLQLRPIELGEASRSIWNQSLVHGRLFKWPRSSQSDILFNNQ